MTRFSKPQLPLPLDQQRLQARCFHPCGHFSPFAKAETAQSLPDRFESIVEQYPDRLAIKTQFGAVTYATLNQMANRVAHTLLDGGDDREEAVSVGLDQGWQSIVALLGLLKAGKFYVPLPPQLPLPQQLARLRDAQASWLVTDSAQLAAMSLPPHLRVINIDNLDDGQRIDNPALPLSPDRLAAVIYTSGSTGQPKGSMDTHRNLLHEAMRLTNIMHISPEDRQLLLRDGSAGAMSDIVCTLLNGAALFPFDLSKRGFHDLANWICDEQITLYRSAPSVWRHFTHALTPTALFPTLRLVFICGEPVNPQDIERYQQHCAPHCLFINCLGLTETATVTTYLMDQNTPIENRVVPVGYPVEDMMIDVVDASGQSVGFHREGEIVVQSRYLSRGYLHHPELTAAAFRPLPGGGEERAYWTGDMGILRPDGELICLGRRDGQFKIRGQKGDVTQVEMALTALDGIEEAVAGVRDDDQGSQRLVAYLVPTGPTTPTVSELRHQLEGHLPPHLMPSSFVVIKAFPLGPTGKIDRLSLPVPDTRRPQLDTPYVQPRNAIERKLARIWSELLKVEGIGADDKFFDLGGDSLLAVHLFDQIKRVFGQDLPLAVMFQASTIAELADAIVMSQSRRPKELIVEELLQRIADLSPEKRARLEQWLLNQERPSTPNPVSRRQVHSTCPLSFAQQRLWFLQQVDPESPCFNEVYAVRMQGEFRLEAMQQALDALVARHEILRTTFVAPEGAPVQVIGPAVSVEITVLDRRDLNDNERRQLGLEECRRPFDLTRDLMIRAVVIRSGPDDQELFVALHHLATDGWSMGILRRELSQLYTAFVNATPVSLPDLPIQYADYAVWQRQQVEAEDYAHHLAYWVQCLEGVPEFSGLPTDRPRPAVQTYRGARLSWRFPAVLSERLNRFSQQQNVTLFMILLAAFQTLIMRYTSQVDIVVGAPVAGRTHRDLEPLMGPFLNTLLLRTNLSGQPTFSDLLSRVNDVCLNAYAHQEVPVELIFDRLQPERHASHPPLFQLMLNFFSGLDATPLQLTGLQTELERPDLGTSVLDVALYVKAEGNSLSIQAEYNTDLFDDTTITRLLSHWQHLLEDTVTDPDQPIASLALMSEAERQQVLVDWNNSPTPYLQDQSLMQRFEAQVNCMPEAIAVVDGSQRITYRELNSRANQLAHYLRRSGVKPEVRVGVCLDPSIDLVVGVFGVFKAAGVYVPLDPTYPTERLAFMLQDAEVSVLITTQPVQTRKLLEASLVCCLDRDADKIGRERSSNPTPQITWNDAAYVMYTSGSTGQPKGAIAEHSQLLNRFAWMWQTYPFAAGEVGCLKTSVNFVDALWELFGFLLQGSPLVVIPHTIRNDPHELVKVLSNTRVTRIMLVPSLLRLLLDTYGESLQQTLPKLTLWCTGGEAISASLWRRFESCMPHARLVNIYGLSEAFDVAWFDRTADLGDRNRVPIGRPLPNVQLYVLDAYRQPVPIGVSGELYLGGVALVRGYLNQSERTAQSFIAHPFDAAPQARLYKTGDQARWLPNGDVELLGRMDDQVKIRGFRVALDEIETVLGQHPDVMQVGLNVQEMANEENRLVAYLVPNPQDTPLSVTSIRRFLSQTLPAYMHPSVFEVVGELPLTPSGKLDRQSLPAPSQRRPELEVSHTLPRNPLERQLVQMWVELLQVDPIGIHDRFFDLGGDSLLAVRLFARIEQAFGKKLPLAIMFHAATVAQLAEAIAREEEAFPWSSVVALQATGSKPPLFLVHGGGGHLLIYQRLATYLGADQPMYGLQPPSLDGEFRFQPRVEDMATHYIHELRTIQPEGPYRLGGMCFGGTIAFEMARQLHTQGDEVAFLGLFDPAFPYQDMTSPAHVQHYIRRNLKYPGLLLHRVLFRFIPFWLRYRALKDIKGWAIQMVSRVSPRQEFFVGYADRFASYHAKPYEGRCTFFCGSERAELAYHPWEAFAVGDTEWHVVPASHVDMFAEPHVQVLTDKLRLCLEHAKTGSS